MPELQHVCEAAPPTFVALDFELAGLERSSVCAIGLVRVERGRIVRREHRLVRPPGADFSFSSLHGIERAHVRGAPAFAVVWRDLARHLAGARFIAAHNAAFERSVLSACASRFGVTPPALPFECTVRLARRRWNVRPTTLADVARHLGIPLRHHHALSDAEACARIVLAAR